MTHSNSDLLNSFYERLGRGDIRAMLELCSDDVTFQVPGKSQLAGKYTRETVGAGLFEKLAGLSAGSLKAELHDVMASDRHGLVLSTNTLSRDGKRHEYRTVHVWRIQNGKLAAWYEYPRDLYQFDAIWS
jgi:ketosteroid isomerase-like protein